VNNLWNENILKEAKTPWKNIVASDLGSM
jgi:hypothetical protein